MRGLWASVSTLHNGALTTSACEYGAGGACGGVQRGGQCCLCPSPRRAAQGMNMGIRFWNKCAHPRQCFDRKTEWRCLGWVFRSKCSAESHEGVGAAKEMAIAGRTPPPRHFLTPPPLWHFLVHIGGYTPSHPRQ